MNPNDPPGPFDDSDRTIIRPMPGGRRPQAAEAAPPVSPMPPPAPAYRPVPAAELPAAEFKENPIVAAALSLISLAGRLRQSATYTAVEALRQRATSEVTLFENRLLQTGIGADQTRMASYMLCSFLDETVQNTPWGSQSNWGHQSLLISFHREAWGGEKFFDIVALLVKQPAQNLALIELAYLFISLGFEGKYRILNNGVNELEKYRLELYQLIQRVKGAGERELSPRWRGLRDVRNALVRYVPLWVVGAVLGVLLILVYTGFVLTLNARSDQAFNAVFALAKQPIEIARAALPPPIAKPADPDRKARFQRILAPEIAKDMVEVIDERLIRIRNSFASGNDQLKPEFLPMLKKIADEFAAGNDSVLVIGHTDDQPIASARFPSNWHLSTSRAKKVSERLNEMAKQGGKIRFEGRAEGEPLVPNDSPQHRAVNRRVDLQIQ